MPPPLLEKIDLETADLDEFLDCLAKARFVQELEERIVARAVAEVFSED